MRAGALSPICSYGMRVWASRRGSPALEVIGFRYLHRAAGEVGDAAAGLPQEDSGREGARTNLKFQI